MTYQRNDGLLYLAMYPRLRQWVNQCALCQHIGCKPSIDECPTPIAKRNLKAHFPIMSVNELGQCEQCAAAYRTGVPEE